MKKLLIISTLSLSMFASSLIHPLDFKGTNEEKNEVLSFITKNVNNTYSKIGMGDPATLRMMEEEELKSFKILTKAENRKLLDSVITQYCSIGICTYSTIKMMYDEQLYSSQKKLNW
jgi:hypothetical protein